NHKKQLNGLLNLMMAGVTLVALHGIFQYITGAEMPPGWVDSAEAGVRTRAFSIAGNPNALGGLMTLLIPLTVSHFLTARGKILKTLYAGYAGAMLLCLIFTFSRGAWFAFIGAMTLYSVMYMPLLLVAMTAGTAAAPFLVPGIVNRIAYLFSPAYMVSSARAGRVARWEMALDRVSNNPLTGDGFGRFGGAVADRYIQSSVYVDNFYLKTAAETGLVGIAVFAWLLLSGIRCATNAFRRVVGDNYLRGVVAGVTAGLVGILLHNFVENIFEVPMLATYFWFLLGALAATPHLQKDHLH
ncbi:MAG: O-antigen ligase family protein, partial [Desulfotomaculaceae bacterium]